MAVGDVTIIRGDTENIKFSVTLSGNIVDVTGGKLWFTMKQKLTDTDAQAILQKTWAAGGISVPNPTTGVDCFVIIDPIDTTNLTLTHDTDYFYDIQYETVAKQVFTLIRAVITVLVDTTRTYAP